MPSSILHSLSAFLLALCVGAGPDSRATFIAHGDATMDLARSAFQSPKTGLYSGDIKDGKRGGPDFAWGNGVTLSALAAAAKLDPKYKPELRKFVDAMDGYWLVSPGIDGKPIGGFNASIHPRDPDRYYDDNEWLALGFVEAYEITRNPADLDRAKKALAFAFSGEDQKLGGGLYWHEQKLESKNTCSNGPGAAAALRVYSITKDPKTFEAGKRVYDWTRANLQNKDGLFADNIDLNGKKHGGALTYNCALMIRSACLMFDCTKDRTYLAEAQRIANASADHFVDKKTGVIKDAAKFAHLLAEAFLEVGERDNDPKWAQINHAALAFVWDHNRDKNGYHPDRWNDADVPSLTTLHMIDQASAARAFYRAAWDAR